MMRVLLAFGLALAVGLVDLRGQAGKWTALRMRLA